MQSYIKCLKKCKNYQSSPAKRSAGCGNVLKYPNCKEYLVCTHRRRHSNSTTQLYISGKINLAGPQARTCQLIYRVQDEIQSRNIPSCQRRIFPTVRITE